MKRTIHSFHFFGVTGYVAGTSLGIFLCIALQLPVKVIVLMTLISAGTFFTLAMVAKIIAGKETIVYYHHEIAILIICSMVLNFLGYPVLPYLDITLLGLGTFLAFGRIGCFSVGCCHGKPSPKGVIYGHAHVESGFTSYYENIPLFPVQLLECAFVFIIVLTGSVLLLSHYPPGTTLVLYTVVYGAFRFSIEFFRGDPERIYWRGLSEAQWTTLLLVCITLACAFAGTFPLYIWHIIVTASLLCISIMIVWKIDFKHLIFYPRHVKQIATLLNQLQDDKKVIKQNSPETSIHIFKTNIGLSFSKGQVVHDDLLTTHYSVSSSHSHPLNYPVVEKLGKLIKKLRKHDGSFEITKNQEGVFHILFSEPLTGNQRY